MKIEKRLLKQLYMGKKMSVAQIAKKLGYSISGINYWINLYGVKKRSISEAIYLKHNPKGDPFSFRKPFNISEAKLFGLGIGLYWGEGTKANKNTVRIGNSDVNVIKTFISFLDNFFKISKYDLKFQLQIFSDIDVKEAERYWLQNLMVNKSQLYKTVITRSVAKGTYKHKSEYGVMTLYYGNTKLRNILVSLLPK
jgi:hypothetical protein